MLSIRLNRTGKRNRAQFRIVVQEHTVAPGGRHIEVLGSYDPHRKYGIFKAERIKYWMGTGAQVSDSVWNLLIKNKIIEGAKRTVKMKKKPAEDETAEVKPEPSEKKEETKKETEKEEKKDEVKTEEKPAESDKTETIETKEVKPEEKKEESKKE